MFQLLHQRRLDELKQKKALRKMGRETPPVDVDPWMPTVDNFVQPASKSMANGLSVEHDSSSILNSDLEAASQSYVTDPRTSINNCEEPDSLVSFYMKK